MYNIIMCICTIHELSITVILIPSTSLQCINCVYNDVASGKDEVDPIFIVFTQRV